MAARPLLYFRAFIVLCLYSLTTALYDPQFPTAKDFEFTFYSTEVQITDVYQEVSAYATEYHYKEDNRGAVKIYFQGEMRSVYYDNSTYQIMDVVVCVEKFEKGSTSQKSWDPIVIGNPPALKQYNCTVKDVSDSDFDKYPIYFGWLNQDPLVIGPSAPLWYAQTRYKEVKYVKKETVRDIECNRFQLALQNKNDNLTIDFFFALQDWTTPYKYKELQVPIRIRISGKSSRYAADPKLFVDVDQINDFAYFKPSLGDANNLLPPLGLGCEGKKRDETFPSIPKAFRYSAEVVDLLKTGRLDDIEVQFQKTWFDSERLLARRDKYTRKDGFSSGLYDFNTGVVYRVANNESCEIKTLRNTDFQIFDYGVTSRIKTPKEVLNLNGDFYPMGKRQIRGLDCDVYESVEYDGHYLDTLYYKLVVTVYFINGLTNVAVDGKMESRIPVYYIITGYSSPTNITLKLQYNVFGFDDLIWPQMYSTFRLDRCYLKPESKSYFVLIMEVDIKTAAKMEELDETVMIQLKSAIAEYAKIPEMRISYLKADYKPTGVFVTGLMLERPPAFMQFYYYDENEHTLTSDKFLKIVPANTKEKCAYSCVDEADFLCKGFYWCNEACFLKSTDPEDFKDSDVTKDLGQCTEYLRDQIESSNYRQSYLSDALGNLESAVLNGTVNVRLVLPGMALIVSVQDVIIGDGPYTGVDGSDKPYKISVPFRKLSLNTQTTRGLPYADSLFDCYKQCKQSGSECSSFSYCPDADDDSKECVISSSLVIDGVTKDTDLVPDRNCNIYNLKFLDYFTAYPERISLLAGDKVINSVETTEKCAENCRKEKDFKCRGFEYCRTKKACSLHKTHILDLKAGSTASSGDKQCIHYAARYVADYDNMGRTLVDDTSNVRYQISLEECAKICSEDLGENCKSFNFCPDDASQSSCALSKQILRQGGPSLQKDNCKHYEKRDSVHDWDKSKAQTVGTDGYTRKGFAGLVVGMLALGLVIGALAFVFYSYMKSRNSGEGMVVKFLKNET